MALMDHGPFRTAVKIVSAVIYAACGLAFILLLVRLVGRLDAGDGRGALTSGLGLLAAVVVAAGWFIAAWMVNLLAGNAEELARLHRTTRAASDRQAQMLADMLERLDGLVHWTAMGEATRGLLARRREAEVFIGQIESAIGEGEWAEAERLLELYRDHFQDAARAAQLHQKLATARELADDRTVRARIAEVRALIDQHNFPAAELALDRLAKERPDDKRIEDLRTTCQRARRRYQDAAQDRFSRLLAERKLEEASTLLDEMRWLDPDGMKALREQWRETFRLTQAENRQAFSAAVKENQWARAVEVGELILRRYAESALAGDVRKVIDTLRKRAEAAAAAASAEPEVVPDQPPRA